LSKVGLPLLLVTPLTPIAFAGVNPNFLNYKRGRLVSLFLIINYRGVFARVKHVGKHYAPFVIESLTFATKNPSTLYMCG